MLLVPFSVPIKAADGMIADDTNICGAIRMGSFNALTKSLKEFHNTTLEASYFKIRCGNQDVMGMVVENPAARYWVASNMIDYFKEDVGKPELFSRALLNEVNAKDILDRIRSTLYRIVRNNDLRELYERRLLFMSKKYTAYLKQYPVSGSAEAVAKHEVGMREHCREFPSKYCGR